MPTEVISGSSLADSANPLDRYVHEYLGTHAKKLHRVDNADQNPVEQDAVRSERSADLVSLTQNSLAGANALLQQRAKVIQNLSVADFPYALRKLTASQLEDFLCMYGDKIERFTTTDWIRVDRDWRGT